MDKYDLLQQIGDGTFGSVVKAVHKKSGQLVAIKRMKQKYYSWEECVNLPEVQVLRKLQAHPNVIKLREVVRENNELFFVFEFMDGDLLGVIRKHKQNIAPAAMLTSPAVPYTKIKAYMFQLMQSLAFLHKSGYFHRDLKPENLLIRKDPMQNHEVIKLADFGLVKEVRARPPYTDYVSTRWYRAPELLLQDRNYTCAVDVWAAGCIFAELITTKPLFPGNNEVDQLFKIMAVLGSPTEGVWPDGIQLARKIRYQFPLVAGTPLRAVFPQHVPSSAIDLISKMLVYDPKKRMTAQQCLSHPYFNVGLDEEPLTAYATASAARPAGGTQSAPNIQAQMQTPVQWRQAAEKEAANSANKAQGGSSSQAILPLMPNANRPASGNRPMFPPVEISKHSFSTNATTTNATTTAQNNNTYGSATNANGGGDVVPSSHVLAQSNAMSKYYLVPTGLSPKLKESNTSGMGVNSNNTVPVAPQKQFTYNEIPPLVRPPTKVVDSEDTTHPNQTKSSTKPTPKPLKAGAVDLDSLMDEFQTEMSAMGFQTKRETAEKDNSGALGSAALPAAKEYKQMQSLLQQRSTPTGSLPPTGATSTGNKGVGIKGLPQPLLNTTFNGSSSGNLGALDDSSPLQKLLQNSRYKPSFHTPSPMHPSSALPSGSSAVKEHRHSEPLHFHHATINSPTAVAAATRYDMDSASYASLDVGSSSLACSTNQAGGGGGRKAVLGGATVSPSVNTLLSKQAFKPAQLPLATEDDDLPAWLKMVNERPPKRSTPTLDFGKPTPGKR